MAVQLYRRHRKECEAERPEDSRSGEFEEGRRGWKRVFTASFTCRVNIGGKFKRQSTGHWRWEDARAVTDECLKMDRDRSQFPRPNLCV